MITRGIVRLVRRAVEGSAQLLRLTLPPQVAIVLRQELAMVGRLDYEECEVRLHADSELEWTTRLHSCVKEPGTVRWLEHSLRSGDVLFDVGANVGAYSLLAAKLHRGAVRVVAFEPSARNFVQLAKNVTLNGCEDIVVPLPLALDSATRLIDFHYRDTRPGAALHAMRPQSNRSELPFVSATHQSILAFRLDDLVRQFNLPVPTHMKIDVDGPELDVLRGAEATLRDPTLRSVLIEVDEDSDTRHPIELLMSAAGFKITERHFAAAPRLPGQSGMYNWVLERDAAESRRIHADSAAW